MEIDKKLAAAAPIGIFDSGVGGLTVAREIHKQLPHESLIYLGDTARTPYGTKAGETVKRFTMQCIRHLARLNIKALVVACNTASAYALPMLRQQFKFPIIGVIKPGARAALAGKNGGTIGVIGTRATIQSQTYARTIKSSDRNRKVISTACPLLVPLVEEGWLQGEVSKKIVAHYLKPLLGKDVKHLILGCTHYPALKPIIKEVCGKKVLIIDSAEEVTKELKAVLVRHKILYKSRRIGTQKYSVTDVPDQFVKVGTHIIGKRITSISRVTLTEAIN